MHRLKFLAAFCAVSVLFSSSFGSAAVPFSAGPVQKTPSRLPPSVSRSLPLPEIERILFESINRERVARNLRALRLSPTLTTLARKQSEDMAKLGVLEHVSAAGKSYTERLEEAGIPFASNGENVARSDSFDPALIHETFMASGGHRENILHPDFDDVGVGVVRGPDGIYYITQEFIRSVAVLDEAAVRAAILLVLDEVRRSQGLAPLLVVEEITRKAQIFARLKGEGKSLPPLPKEYGETRVDFYAGPDLDKIAAAIREHSLEGFQMTGVGVHFARTPEYPAGAYSICAFLLGGDPTLLWNEQERVRAVLQTLNEVRSQRKMRPLELDTFLSRRANRLAQSYQKNKSGLTGQAGRAVAVFYETPALERMAPSLHVHIANPNTKRVGISVRLAGAGPGLNVNFLVVLLLEG
jgi:uncharacterized protein YkwD